MTTDWTYGFSKEDIAHMARFLGCDDVAAARQLQADWEKDEADREADDALYDKDVVDDAAAELNANWTDEDEAALEEHEERKRVRLAEEAEY